MLVSGTWSILYARNLKGNTNPASPLQCTRDARESFALKWDNGSRPRCERFKTNHITHCIVNRLRSGPFPNGLRSDGGRQAKGISVSRSASLAKHTMITLTEYHRRSETLSLLIPCQKRLCQLASPMVEFLRISRCRMI